MRAPPSGPNHLHFHHFGGEVSTFGSWGYTSIQCIAHNLLQVRWFTRTHRARKRATVMITVCLSRIQIKTSQRKRHRVTSRRDPSAELLYPPPSPRPWNRGASLCSAEFQRPEIFSEFHYKGITDWIHLQALSHHGGQAGSKSQPSNLMVGLSDDQAPSWVISTPSINSGDPRGSWMTKTLLLLGKCQGFRISPLETRDKGQWNSLL